LKKRMISHIGLTVALAAGLLSGCSGGNNNAGNNKASDGASPGEQTKAPVEISYLWQGQVMPNEVPTLRDKELEKKLNVKFDPEYITLETTLDKLNVQFASGHYPDAILNMQGVDMLKKWGEGGYLLPLNDYLDKIPNYRKLFSDEEWEALTKFASAADGNLYFLPGANPVKMQRTWVYRKDIFDKENLTPPQTTEELYQTLKKLKAKYPDSVPMSSRWGLDGMLDGFTSAFRTSSNFWLSPETNEIEYAPASNHYRDMLAYLSKLYKENLMEKEFATITGPQWEQKNVTGKSLIEYSYSNRPSWFEAKMTDVPGADWAMSDQLVRAYDEPALAYREQPFNVGGGVAITTNAKGEKLDKLLEMINWLCTPEGIRLMEIGVEGQQYDLIDGKVKKKKEFEDIIETYKQTGFSFFLGRETNWAEPTEGDLAIIKTYDTFKDQPFFPFVSFGFNEEDTKTRNSLLTGLNDTRAEFSQKAIMGTVDVSNDDVWNGYLKDLEKAGLSTLLDIHKRSVK
jgi:putative aldouronate transport system substrate-binding protein